MLGESADEREELNSGGTSSVKLQEIQTELQKAVRLFARRQIRMLTLWPKSLFWARQERLPVPSI